jgi:hypothetical protein
MQGSMTGHESEMAARYDNPRANSARPHTPAGHNGGPLLRHANGVNGTQSSASLVEMERNVSSRYEYRGQPQVHDFLVSHIDIAVLLLEAIPHIETIFGTDTSVRLYLVCDQESDPTLAAYIQTSKPFEEAKSLRKRFYREWWMDQALSGEGLLTFDVDCI